MGSIVVILSPRPEQGHEVLQAKLEVLDFVSAKCGSCQSTLAILEGEDTLLDGFLDRQFVYVDVARLTQAMGTVESLVFERWVPPHIDQNHVVTSSQVETWS
jgi:hypothetical protein